MWAMVAFLLRRVAFGLVALFLGLSGSFLFLTSKYQPSTPILHAYKVWLRGLPNGHSISSSLFLYVGAAFGRTLLLLALTLVIVLAVAIPLAYLAAARRGSALDFLLRCGSYAAWAVPGFLLATLLQEGFGRVPGGWGLPWFPYIGWAGECPDGQGIDQHNFQCPSGGTGLTHVGLVLDHLALPAIALALGFIGLHARYLRASLLNALDAPHITVARAKGLPERAVLLRHAMRNALVAFVPALVSDFGLIFGAALAVDYIFQLGGMGTYFISALALNVDAYVSVDTYALQLTLLLGGALILTASVLGEITLWLLDPRARPD
jgi:peptide/nickel transport system permease protein